MPPPADTGQAKAHQSEGGGFGDRCSSIRDLVQPIKFKVNSLGQLDTIETCIRIYDTEEQLITISPRSYADLKVITGISIIIYATAYLNAGHPPASGIIALIVVAAITPVAGLCLFTAMLGRFAYEGRKHALYYLLLGINIL